MKKLRRPKTVQYFKKRATEKRKAIERKKAGLPDSKLEVTFQNLLKELNIPFQCQFQLDYKFYDFKIKGKKILIEVDGDYWHCNPKKYPDGPINKKQQFAIKNDKFKNLLAKKSGYTLIRVWEEDINKRPLVVLEKLKKLLLEE